MHGSFVRAPNARVVYLSFFSPCAFAHQAADLYNFRTMTNDAGELSSQNYRVVLPLVREGFKAFFCIELEGYMGEARAALGGGEPDFFSFGGLGWKCCKVFLCPPLVFGSQNSAVFK